MFNVKPEVGEGTPGICGALDFLEEFLVKILNQGPKMGKIRSNIPHLDVAA